MATTLNYDFSDAQVVGDGVWPKFKFIQAFMVILVTCKNEDPFENEGTSVVTNLSHYKSLEIFQTLKVSLLLSPRSDLAEFEPI